MLVSVIRFVIALTDVAITKIDEHREQRRVRKVVRHIQRAHLWGFEDPPLCAYCGVEQTATNEHMLCPNTGKLRAK